MVYWHSTTRPCREKEGVGFTSSHSRALLNVFITNRRVYSIEIQASSPSTHKTKQIDVCKKKSVFQCHALSRMELPEYPPFKVGRRCSVPVGRARSGLSRVLFARVRRRARGSFRVDGGLPGDGSASAAYRLERTMAATPGEGDSGPAPRAVTMSPGKAPETSDPNLVNFAGSWYNRVTSPITRRRVPPRGCTMI